MHGGVHTALGGEQDLFPPVSVVRWEMWSQGRQRGMSESGSDGWAFPAAAPLQEPASPGQKNPLSYNKIPGVALIGEGLGKVWGGVKVLPFPFFFSPPTPLSLIREGVGKVWGGVKVLPSPFLSLPST